MKKKILYRLGIAFIIWVVFNTIIFVGIIQETQNMPFASARVYMLSAEKINEIYIFPLSHFMGWDNPLTWPFYLVRDNLYNTGLSKFPKSEGEKEIWWYKIRYIEFREVVEDLLTDYCLNEPAPYVSKKQIKEFYNWDDELFEHVKSFSTAKITNKKFRDQKLEVFVDIARRSQEIHGFLSSKHNNLYKQKNGNPFYHAPDVEQVQRFKQVYEIYKKTINNSKVNEKDSYETYINNPRDIAWSLIFKNNLSFDVVLAYFAAGKPNCNSEYLRLFVESDKAKRDMYSDNTINIPHNLRNHLGSYSVIPMIAYKCQEKPFMKDYVNFVISNTNRYSKENLKTIEDVKNRDYKILKEENKNDEIKFYENIYKHNK